MKLSIKTNMKTSFKTSMQTPLTYKHENIYKNTTNITQNLSHFPICSNFVFLSVLSEETILMPEKLFPELFPEP